MLSSCLKYGRNAESKNPLVGKTKKGRMMLLWNCAVFSSKNWHLYKNKKQKIY